jgi:hypothetical protein
MIGAQQSESATDNLKVEKLDSLGGLSVEFTCDRIAASMTKSKSIASQMWPVE